MLQNAGLGDALNSWIGAGPNQSVSAADISRAFGDGQLQQLADSAGVSQGEAAEHLSSLLPELVNKLTPDGQAPGATWTSVRCWRASAKAFPSMRGG